MNKKMMMIGGAVVVVILILIFTLSSGSSKKDMVMMGVDTAQDVIDDMVEMTIKCMEPDADYAACEAEGEELEARWKAVTEEMEDREREEWEKKGERLILDALGLYYGDEPADDGDYYYEEEEVGEDYYYEEEVEEERYYDVYVREHNHISTCYTCGISYTVQTLPYLGKYCSQTCCGAYERDLRDCGY